MTLCGPVVKLYFLFHAKISQKHLNYTTLEKFRLKTTQGLNDTTYGAFSKSCQNLYNLTVVSLSLNDITCSV